LFPRDGHSHELEIVDYQYEMRTIAAAKPPKLLPPVHPGEILREDFMKPLRLTVNKPTIDLHVSATRIGELVHQRRPITADTVLRLARYFKTNPEFWFNVQTFYEVGFTRSSGAVSDIERYIHPAAELLA
jgi:antitoxin HigA-1